MIKTVLWFLMITGLFTLKQANQNQIHASFSTIKTEVIRKKHFSTDSAYLFAYFTGNSKGEEAIRFAISRDGYHYKALNHNQPVLDAAKISSTGGLRDPHILRGADGKSFYMVAPI